VVAVLALVPQGQHERHIGLGVVAVQREVARAPARNDDLGCGLQKEVGQSFKIGRRLGGNQPASGHALALRVAFSASRMVGLGLRAVALSRSNAERTRSRRQAA